MPLLLAGFQAVLPGFLETALLQGPYALSHVGRHFYATRRKRVTSHSQAAEAEQPHSAASGSINDSAAPTSSPLTTAVAAAMQPPGTHRVQALNTAIQHLNKKLGSGTIMRLGDQQAHNIECIPSGCLTLDIALGGGWPRGRICEIYGQESTGKTTLALHAIAEAQKLGGQAVLIDAEHAFNKEFARKIGVNIESLAISQPSCGEEALHVVDELLRCGGVDIIVVDSVAALVPRAELEGDIGDAKVALQARLMSQALRKLAGNAAKTGTTVIFVNQIRFKINTGSFMPPGEITSGGQALKYYASNRVEVKFATSADGGKHVEGADKQHVGVRIKAKVVKNKVAPPYRNATFVIEFNKGIDPNATLLEACEQLGIVSHKGAHYYLKDQKLGHGREAVKHTLAEDTALRTELTGLVRQTISDPVLLERVLMGQHSESEEEEAAAA